MNSSLQDFMAVVEQVTISFSDYAPWSKWTYHFSIHAN